MRCRLTSAIYLNLEVCMVSSQSYLSPAIANVMRQDDSRFIAYFVLLESDF
jgi:purine-cytosine permease-like protein